MKTAIVTGFGRFGDYAVNPTGDLAKALHSKDFGGHLIHGRVLPTSIFPAVGHNYGEQLVKKAFDTGAKIILSFGIDSSVTGFRIESVGSNLIANEKYCSARLNGTPVLPSRSRKDRVVNPLPGLRFDELKEQFRIAGVPMEPEISQNAGGYCCNALIYLVLQHLFFRRFENKVSFLFCHVPCTEASIRTIPDFDRSKTLITEEQLYEGVRQILLHYDT